MDERIRRLRAHNVYFGTSSWKYAGWKGLIYQKPYKSEKEFAEYCLTEYADHYPAVGVDHTYYDWPREATFARYMDQTPADFRFVCKATEEVTVFKYPKLPRYGKRSGVKNEAFLSGETFVEKFVRPLAKWHDRLGPVMFEFSQFYPGMLSSGGEFLERLDRFFATLKVEGGIQYAVELRNHNWLKPA